MLHRWFVSSDKFGRRSYTSTLNDEGTIIAMTQWWRYHLVDIAWCLMHTTTTTTDRRHPVDDCAWGYSCKHISATYESRNGGLFSFLVTARNCTSSVYSKLSSSGRLGFLKSLKDMSFGMFIYCPRYSGKTLINFLSGETKLAFWRTRKNRTKGVGSGV